MQLLDGGQRRWLIVTHLLPPLCALWKTSIWEQSEHSHNNEKCTLYYGFLLSFFFLVTVCYIRGCWIWNRYNYINL